MPQHLQHLSRSLAVVTVSLSLISYLPMPRAVCRVSALATAATVSPALPALQGEAAVHQLKHQGLYDSLSEAVAATRSKRRWEGQTILTGLPTAYQAANPAQRLAAYFTPSELQLAPLAEQELVREGRVSAPSAWRGARSNHGSIYRPSWVEQQKLYAPDWSTNHNFGMSVAVSGDTAVVGSPLDDIGANFLQGSAYVFVREGSTWSFQQKLTASGGAAGDWFGFSVAISGDTVVVGAINDDIGADNDQGSAYVFVRSDATWIQQQKLTASDGSTHDVFGASVAISGDTAVVGSPHDDIGANFTQGSAYVFVRSGLIWSQQQKLTASDGSTDDCFGYSVAMSGETVVVGAYRDAIGANEGQGSAYVFVRSGWLWFFRQKLIASSGEANDGFGFSVAISGTTIVVGSPFDHVGADSDQGSAYVFVPRGWFWTQQLKIIVSDGADDDWFGLSVAISGDTAVVGSPNNSGGAAYVFVRDGTAWFLQHKLTGGTGAAGDSMGRSVAINGDTAVVGAPWDDIAILGNTYEDRGSAYIFVRSQ